MCVLHTFNCTHYCANNNDDDDTRQSIPSKSCTIRIAASKKKRLLTFMVSWLTNTVRWSRVSSSMAARLACSSLSSLLFSDLSDRRGLRLLLRLLLTLVRRLLRRESSCFVFVSPRHASAGFGTGGADIEWRWDEGRSCNRC